MPRLDVRPEAELDALEAASWYDGERDGLGLEFLTELRATFARIEEGPRHYPLVFHDFAGPFCGDSRSECSSFWKPMSQQSWRSRTCIDIPMLGKTESDDKRPNNQMEQIGRAHV